MQIDNRTGEVYAACESTAKGETIELMTLSACHHVVVVWDDVGELRWQVEFTNDLASAVAEYNKWARVHERVPTFN